MIAPCNSKTAFLPAVQQKCPEKAVFVFGTRTALETKPHCFGLWNSVMESSRVMPKYSDQLIFVVTKLGWAPRMLSKDSRAHARRLKYFSKAQNGKVFDVISNSTPIGFNPILNFHLETNFETCVQLISSETKLASSLKWQAS